MYMYSKLTASKVTNEIEDFALVSLRHLEGSLTPLVMQQECAFLSTQV